MDHNAALLEIVRKRAKRNTATIALIFDSESYDCVYKFMSGDLLPGNLVLCKIEEVATFLTGECEIDEWITFSLFDEEGVRRALTSSLAEANILLAKITSCLNDLLVEHLSRDIVVASETPDDPNIAKLPAYAVVCAPRCGSTFLVEMLASVGLGRPEEHLRAAEIAALSDLQIGERDAVSLLTTFLWRHQRNFVFGTKVISHFLFSLLSKISIPPAVCNHIKAHFSIIYLVRKDKVGQAISDFLANKSYIWHVRDAESLQALSNKHQVIEYSFEDILRRYKFMMEEEKKLSSYIKDTNHLVYFFEDLVADPDAAVGAVAKFLGFKDIGTPTAKVIKTESPINAILRERFVSDFRARFNSDPEECAPLSGLNIASEESIPSVGLRSLVNLKINSGNTLPSSVGG